MNTHKTETVQAPAPSRRARIMARAMGLPRPVRYLLALVLSLTAMFGAATPSFATDNTGTSSLFTSAGSSISGTLIPAVVAIVLIGSLFWLGVRWYQKGKNAGNK